MGAVYEALDRKTKQTVAVKQAFFAVTSVSIKRLEEKRIFWNNCSIPL